MVAMRDSGHELRRVVWKQRGQCLRHVGREVVVLDPVPEAEQERAAKAQHSTRFGKGCHLVRQEHVAELADDQVHALIIERKRHCIGLKKTYLAAGTDAGGLGEHGGVDVGGDDGDLGRQLVCELARNYAGACGNFKHGRRMQRGRSGSQIQGIGLEEHGHHVPLIKLRNGAGKDGAANRYVHDEHLRPETAGADSARRFKMLGRAGWHGNQVLRVAAIFATTPDSSPEPRRAVASNLEAALRGDPNRSPIPFIDSIHFRRRCTTSCVRLLRAR
ncbi:hypothetical protein SDC9_95607 [bioreactor metagenome]|uniref:Uncharacterized protein n=1 Tax=bioreactor metagenome TaxID=1076179 RepID=A0A645A6T5_9ZZZZ